VLVQHRVIELGENRAIYRATLNSGLTVLAVENSAADIVAARIFLRAGSRWEPRKLAGLSQLVSAVITKGTDQLSSLEIAERVESIGASLGADSSSDYFLLSLKTVSADFADMLKLAGELLRSPTFPEEEVELERRLTLQAIRSQKEQPFTVAFDQLRQAMYQEHPYALSGLGTEASVAQLTREDLQHYHQTYFRPDNVVISLVGRINPTEAITLVEEVFGDWQVPQTSVPEPLLTPILSQPHPVVQEQETQQSIVMLGYLAPEVGAGSPENSVDYIALKLLNTYLGSGLSSRLFVELREKRGLAYDVSAFYPTRLDTSQFVVYMGTAPENTAIAMEGLQTEVERLRNIVLSPQEFQAAKNKLLGQYALGKQTNAQIAQILGWYEILGLSVTFDLHFQQAVAELDAETAQATAQQYFTAPYISLVGPKAVVSGLAVPPPLATQTS
jgi:zinc protease